MQTYSVFVLDLERSLMYAHGPYGVDEKEDPY